MTINIFKILHLNCLLLQVGQERKGRIIIPDVSISFFSSKKVGKK